MSTHQEYAEWDAAYVLGALSPTQRLEYEDHLAGCLRCTNAVGELAAIPGLLGKLPAEDVSDLLSTAADGRYTDDPEPAPAGILVALAARVRWRRRVRAWTIGLVGVAAAAAIATGIMLPAALNAPAQPAVTASLQQVAISPISANIQLSTATWGTTIALTCQYNTGASTTPTSTYHPSNGRYALYVIDRSGVTSRVSTWTAGPGAIVHVVGSIDTAVAAIQRVELRSLDTGDVLLSHTFNAITLN